MSKLMSKRYSLGLAVIGVAIALTAGPAAAAVPTNNYFPIAGYTRASSGCSNNFQIWDAGVLVAPYPRMGTWTAAGGGGVPDAYQPVGFLDSVTARGGGAIGLYGWAVDPDTPTRAISVHIYLTKSNGARVGTGGLTANRSRPDAGTAYPAYGPNHGYETVLNGFPVGSTKVDAYAIASSNTPNDHRLLGTKWVTVR